MSSLTIVSPERDRDRGIIFDIQRKNEVGVAFLAHRFVRKRLSDYIRYNS